MEHAVEGALGAAFDVVDPAVARVDVRRRLDTRLAGAETTITKYGTGCKPGGHAEL